MLMSVSIKRRSLLARRKQKQKNNQKNKFKTKTQCASTVKSADVDKIAYEVFGALIYSSDKTF